MEGIFLTFPPFFAWIFQVLRLHLSRFSQLISGLLAIFSISSTSAISIESINYIIFIYLYQFFFTHFMVWTFAQFKVQILQLGLFRNCTWRDFVSLQAQEFRWRNTSWLSRSCTNTTHNQHQLHHWGLWGTTKRSFNQNNFSKWYLIGWSWTAGKW